MEQAKLGDVIYVSRGAYRHFGVYSGNNKVIHYTKDYNGGVIRETSISTFLGDSNTYHIIDFSHYRKNDAAKVGVTTALATALLGPIGGLTTAAYHVTKNWIGEKVPVYSPSETVKRAREKIGERGYNLLVHNCEHFAIWCKTGEYRSEQCGDILNMFT